MTTLVLAGAGHAHAQVLQEFARSRPPGLKIVLVSPHVLAPYSGMVPGWLAGHYRWEECCIDFRALCQASNALFIASHITGVDTVGSQLILENGERIPYDWLSLNIGSTLFAPESPDLPVIPMRPLAEVPTRWEALLDQVRQLRKGARFRLVTVGGGAAGVECILAAHHRITELAPGIRLQSSLVTQGEQIVPGLSQSAARRLQQQLNQRKIFLVQNFAAKQIVHKKLISEQGQTLSADALLWATGAKAYSWPKEAGLACDEQGFVQVDAMLRSTSHPSIFAAGDCASFATPLPKAGVFAVRMGPVLAANLRAAISGKPLATFTAQRRYLVLIGTGGTHAIGAWGPVSWQGKWVWRWKQAIDQSFIRRYRKL